MRIGDKQFNELIRNIENRIDDVINLRQKILQQMFQGKLSNQNKEDTSVLFLLEEIKVCKQEYIKAQIKATKEKPKLEKASFNLLENIRKKFNNKSFTYLDLSKNIIVSQDILEKEFDKLVNKKAIEKFFDESTLSIKFRLQ